MSLCVRVCVWWWLCARLVWEMGVWKLRGGGGGGVPEGVVAGFSGEGGALGSGRLVRLWLVRRGFVQCGGGGVVGGCRGGIGVSRGRIGF